MPPLSENENQPNLILDNDMVGRQYQELTATMTQQQATRSKYTSSTEAMTIMPPPQNSTKKQLKYVYNSFVHVTGGVHRDQTGSLYIPSISKNKYVFVLYDNDANYVHAVPILSRTKL